MKILLATSAALPELCDDDRSLRAALGDHDATPFVWNEPCDLDAADLVVIRSIWDYYRHEAEFRAFLDRLDAADCRVANPVDVLRWNLDKRYLADLTERGVRTVATCWLDEPDVDAVRDFAVTHQVDEVILKPTISAGGFETYRRRVDADFGDELARILDHSDAMLQPFVPEIVEDGEWSLMFFAGEFSHAVLKTARDGEFRIQTDHGGSVQAFAPPAALVDWGGDLLASFGALPYARVDAVLAGGDPMLMELELIEPELFFRLGPHAAERFVDVLAGRR